MIRPRIAILICFAPALAGAEGPNFDRDVRPILANNCFKCHGFDDAARKGGVRLDTFDGATHEIRPGVRAVLPGDTAASELVRRITNPDEDDRMPPVATGKHLGPAEIETLRQWIASGAAYVPHWSFAPPHRPELPRVSQPNWVRNPIDAFILARLDSEGLPPSPEADPYTLLRRVSLDLTGVPPSLEETTAFMNDTAPGAYERAVDRLLASPRYGERWARPWLDIARYADSKGYEADRKRTIWRYRDWVIDAFNRDLSFDEFTIEQMAGDLLPNPSEEQIVATAFHRNTMTNDEGGTDDEEFRTAAVIDRVNTTMEAWMGLTMGCAQCHTHKYDPFAQSEYYGIYAFFNQTEDEDRPSEAPTLQVLSDEDRANLDRLHEGVRAAHKKLGEATPGFAEALMFWQHSALPEYWADLAASGANPAAAARTLPVSIVRLLLKPADSRDARDWKRLAAYHRYFDPVAKPFVDPLLDAQGAWTEAAENAGRLPVLHELAADKRRETHLFERGSFLAPGDPVEPGVPASLNPWPEGAPKDRLGLAQWLLDPANPLTDRVAVNRHWEQFFGIGLVETVEDFGTQGERPSHPELLDWLAVEFRESGRSFKELCRLIVTSATYRQDSRLTAPLLERDPYNRLLARGPRFRLEAEMIRDAALASSGLLSAKMHGPSVMPPQPDGLWQAAYNDLNYAVSSGEDRYRRGVYTFWRRTSPYPMLTTFDAPDRVACVARRIRTNTPLQSLVLLNDPVYVEAAQALARRMALDAAGSIEGRIDHGFRRVLTRPPSDREKQRLARLYVTELERYRADSTAAIALATDPLGPLEGSDPVRLAAWTVVANVILNLDEAVTKR